MIGTNVNRIRNKKKQKNNTSGVTGVSYHARNKKWYARISFQGKSYGLGYYDNMQDAIKARKAAEEEFFDHFISETTKKKVIEI